MGRRSLLRPVGPSSPLFEWKSGPDRAVIELFAVACAELEPHVQQLILST
jgi:hypothetical protein